VYGLKAIAQTIELITNLNWLFNYTRCYKPFLKIKNMTPKEEAKQIYDELSEIIWIEPIEFETGFSELEFWLPDWVIKKVACTMIDKIPHTKGSITIDYWNEVKIALNGL